MSKSKRFEIYDQEPNGMTFDDVKETKWAGESNKKRAARFGVENDEPHGTTYEDPAKSHINFPKADAAPVLGNKVVAASSGQGEYEPENAAGRLKESNSYLMGGSISVGKSAPKHGREMKKMSRFTR